MSAIALYSYRDVKSKLDKLLEQRAKVYDAGTAVTSSLSDMPKSSGVKDKVGVSAIMIAQLDEEIKQQETVVKAMRDTARFEMAVLDNELETKILSLYYLECLTVEEIAKIMNYTPDYIKQVKRKAVISLNNLTLSHPISPCLTKTEKV